MLFSSMIFLWIFLPIVIVGNLLLSIFPFKKIENRVYAKNIWLLISSLIFYAWGGVKYLLIMFASILINYFGGRIIGSTKKKKIILVLVIICNLGMLFFFKYFNMFVIAIESLMPSGQSLGTSLQMMISMKGTGALGLKYIVLPIGISFFTFQSMSYVIDVYYGKVQVQKKLINFALYVSLFPQLIAGPIVKYSDVETEINYRKESVESFRIGIKRFCYGLGKKVIIANTMGEVADKIWANEISQLGTLVAWLGIIAYTFQIYYDFSGYSDMAIGLGKMFGFNFKENFNYPYLSTSVQEFWRRWHISLSTWFKEYVYIPLGGNRKGNKRTYVNVFLVFLLTGIWHGANFTFIAWGLMYAVLQIIERLFLKKLLDKNPIKILNWFYTISMVIIGWVFFRANTIFDAIEYLRQMFCYNMTDLSILSFITAKLLIVLVFAVLCAGVIQSIFGKLYVKIENNTMVRVADACIQFVLLILSISFIVSGTYNPFIYFQF